MLFNFLWDDVGRKQLPLSKPKQHQRLESLELVGSLKTTLPRPATIYADRGLQEPKRDSASSKMDFQFPFGGGALGSRSPPASRDAAARLSQSTSHRLTM
jgi:hypothetical protein